MILADIQDLAARLGQLLTEDTPDYQRAAANLEDASVLVSAATRQWVPGDDIPDVVRLVTLQAAARTFRNPSGMTQRAMGPFTEGFSATAASGVYLTDAELELLAGVSDEPANGIISVPIRRVGEYSLSCYDGRYAYDADDPDAPPFLYFPEWPC